MIDRVGILQLDQRYSKHLPDAELGLVRNPFAGADIDAEVAKLHVASCQSLLAIASSNTPSMVLN
jgi:DNA-binding winged helix-turn-helix (wHTH) protein